MSQGSLSKIYLTAWWLLAILALLLWYRNGPYERPLAVLIFTLALLPLLWYGICNHVKPQQAAQLLVLILCLQVVGWTAAVYFSTHVELMFWLLLAVVMLSLLILGYILLSGNWGHLGLTWTDAPSEMWLWFYFILLLIPFLVLICCSDSGLTMTVLTLYLLFAMTMVLCMKQDHIPMGTTVLIAGAAFAAWLLGLVI